MCALRSTILGFSITFGVATTVSAIAAETQVCQERIQGDVQGQTLVGELFFEDDVNLVTFVATWWPGYPLVTAGSAVGYYQMSDGSVIVLECSMLRPAYPD